MKDRSNSRIYATLLGIGITALLLGNPQSLKSNFSTTNSSIRSQNATLKDCGDNIWYGQFLNNSSGLYEYRQLDMSSGYTEAMMYGKDYYLVIYVKDIHGNMVGITIPVNSTFTFGAQAGELKSRP